MCFLSWKHRGSWFGFSSNTEIKNGIDKFSVIERKTAKISVFFPESPKTTTCEFYFLLGVVKQFTGWWQEKPHQIPNISAHLRLRCCMVTDRVRWPWVNITLAFCSYTCHVLTFVCERVLAYRRFHFILSVNILIWWLVCADDEQRVLFSHGV